MTVQPVTVTVGDEVAEAVALLEQYPFRHLPVVRLNELVGIVSARDIIFASALPRELRVHGRVQRKKRGVEEIMRQPVHTISPSASARTAVEIMLERGIGCLPVVRGGDMLGIVTETDFLRLFERGGCRSDERPSSEVVVRSSMSKPVQTLTGDEDLLEAAERMRAAGVRHLPVVTGKELVGMLSDRDVRRGLARLVCEDRRLEEMGSAGVPKLFVRDEMTVPCVSIEPERSLRKAAQLMLEHRIGALAVVEQHQLVGILSQRDVLEHYRGCK